MYNCAVNERKLEHCGQCAELPCQMFTQSSDPSHTLEQARLSREKRIGALKLRAQVGTQEWLRQQTSIKADKE